MKNTSSIAFLVVLCPHILQTKGLKFSWTLCTWIFKHFALEKNLSQMSHLLIADQFGAWKRVHKIYILYWFTGIFALHLHFSYEEFHDSWVAPSFCILYHIHCTKKVFLHCVRRGVPWLWLIIERKLIVTRERKVSLAWS